MDDVRTHNENEDQLQASLFDGGVSAPESHIETETSAAQSTMSRHRSRRHKREHNQKEVSTRTAAIGAIGILALGLLVPSCVGPFLTGGSTGSTTLASGSLMKNLRESVRAEPMLNVRIARNEQRIELKGANRILVRSSDGDVNGELLFSPVVAQRNGNGITLRDAQGKVVNYISALVSNADPRVPHAKLTIDIGDASYPGSVLLSPNSSSAAAGLDAINEVAMERYLVGVLAKELPTSWDEETLMAQAIAARSYALHESLRRLERGGSVDLESTDLDQVYGGAVEIASAQRAVERTRGMVLVDDGELVRAYYSSTCGGRPAAAADVWPATGSMAFNSLPALQGSDRESACEDSKFYRWTIKRTRKDVETRLRAWGRRNKHAMMDMESLSSIKVYRRSISKRPGWYEIKDSKGKTYKLRAEDLRVALNETANIGRPGTNDLVRSGDFEVFIEGQSITINGRGWGHGVGMCQFCAQGFAEKGWSHEKMLETFYPGAQIGKVY
ncbi:MAG: SpoIID/LytB domain-containing protein [Phycisphaeraceae bacterium]|nr:SpoIID/LytB domain-containing protein [Phycisphaerales bacterium]MCB9859657.1 SpoIID/LytB domain-containing protein [Phycisphaeraceae bacterium]